MFAIAWQYLSGRATAKEIDDQQKAEWPPHPDRVFQALVAAWGERECAANEHAALEWLERQTPPQLAAPEVDQSAIQVTQAFVPVNDTPSPIKGSGKNIKLCPEIRDIPLGRDRQPRTFATVHVGDAVCALIWTESDPSPADRAALETLCRAVTHVGHSRSLVRMWVTETPPETVWEPATPGHRVRNGLKLRVPHAGRLRRLEQAYKEFVAGRLARNAWPVSQWWEYVPCRQELGIPHGTWESSLIVFRRVGGDGMPGLLQAPAFVRALRATLIAAADGNARAMPWISGHEPNGRPMERSHLAVLPLAHVGHEHADGHLLGMAIALPREMSADERQGVCEVVPGEFALHAGELGTMQLVEEERLEKTCPRALQTTTWTGPAMRWGTVTPIALDRLPPRRHEGDDAWVADELVRCCLRQGLPAPEAVESLPVSPHIGAPTCRAFPTLRRKPDGANRWHVHAVLQFGQPVEGPLVFGAGRYQAYGLCRPLPAEDTMKRGEESVPDAEQVSQHPPAT
jgi:CRISPR-associated protein Csb2